MSARYLPIARQRREPRPNRNDAPDYLNFIRSLPCLICLVIAHRGIPARLGGYDHTPINQRSRTEAAHVGIRGMGQKCSDWEAIPLCACHHRTGEFAHHVIGKRFWVKWRLDRFEVIRKYRDLYELATRDADLQEQGPTVVPRRVA
jgi:hypothetical protein